MSKEKKTYRFIITGGGTGGHVFPAIAIAKALQKVYQQQKIEIVFVGAKGKIETKLVPKAGFPIRTLRIVGMPRSKNIWQMARFAVLIFFSLFTVKKWLKTIKPDAVIGVGGYASFPTLFMAQKMKIPTFIQEQNAFVGVVNKTLASKVSCFFGGYPTIKNLPACHFLYTGNPVREEIKTIHQMDRTEALKSFGFVKEYPTVLVVGGSQGARAINNSILPLLEKFVEHNIQLIWQTGEANFETYKNTPLASSPFIRIVPFIHQMTSAYIASNIIVSRSGALAIAELAIVGKPAILVPLPTAAEDHQNFNAQVLASKNAAIVINEALLPEHLWESIKQLVNNPAQQKELSNNIKSLAIEDADLVIAKKIFETIG